MGIFSGIVVYVVGLARTGRGAVDFLVSAGAIVYAWDDDLDMLEGLPDSVRVVSPDELVGMGVYDDLAGVLVSPGISDEHISCVHAIERGVPIISDISIFAAEFSSIRPICVTGTNGKSTVCKLLGHVFSELGYGCKVGGNIGDSVLGLGVGCDDRLVLELSSYQIERLSPLRGVGSEFECGVVILLNLAIDHLQRHGTMERYAGVKAKLFDYLSVDGLGIVGVDDEYSRDIYERLLSEGRRVMAISGVDYLAAGVGVRDGILWDGVGDFGVIDLVDLPLLGGAHNAQNLAASYVCLRSYGISVDSIVGAFRSFEPLSHRQQFVCRVGGVVFIDDSKATNVSAVLPALLSFSNIYWLGGGIVKDDDFSLLYGCVERVCGGYFFGRDGGVLERAFSDRLDCWTFLTMGDAFMRAFLDASSSGEECVVLLSAGGASFDEFADFVERGEEFQRLARSVCGD